MTARLLDVLPLKAINLDLSAENRIDVLWEVARLVSPDSRQTATIAGRLAEREARGSTGIGEGVAIPHCRIAGLAGIHACLAISRSGIAFSAIDDQPVRLFVGLVSPWDARTAHLPALARVATLLKSPAFRGAVLSSPSARALRMLLDEEEHRLDAQQDALRGQGGTAPASSLRRPATAVEQPPSITPERHPLA